MLINNDLLLFIATMVIPAKAPRKETIIQAYALYYVCEGVKGPCVNRRQDVSVPIHLRDE